MSQHKRKVGRRGQVTIPKELRDRREIEPGDEIVFVETDDAIIIQTPADEERLADGYRKHTERARRLANEMEEASSEATQYLEDAPEWEE